MMLAVIIALAFLSLLFAAGFLVARRLDNYGVVDVVWSYAFGAVVLLVAAVLGSWTGTGALILLLVVLWSLRLGTHLFLRVKAEHPLEDRRYEDLRRKWKDGFGRRMFFFFQAQAASVLVLSLPFLLILRDPRGIDFWAIAGVIIWAIGLTGEAVADRQLHLFKKSRNKDKPSVCQVGLWRYSRHPNYFFEWLIWVGFAVIAAGSSWGCFGILSPAIIYYLLVYATGIPPSEASSLRSKGEGYRRYQQTTNAFFPWPPRSA
jgi:steroid 5-alpha reductase family enzyme